MGEKPQKLPVLFPVAGRQFQQIFLPLGAEKIPIFNGKHWMGPLRKTMLLYQYYIYNLYINYLMHFVLE